MSMEAALFWSVIVHNCIKNEDIRTHALCSYKGKRNKTLKDELKTLLFRQMIVYASCSRDDRFVTFLAWAHMDCHRAINIEHGSRLQSEG